MEKSRNSRKVKVGAIAAVVVLAGGYIAGLNRIPAGTAGVVYKANGGVTQDLLTQGWRWSFPILTDVSIYSTSMEIAYMCAGEKGDSKDDESFMLMTADGKEVRVDLEFSYKFNSDKLADVFVYHKGKDGNEVKETFIKPKMMTVANNISTQFNVFDIYGSQRPKLNDEITKAASEYFAEYGIIIDRVSVTSVTPDEATKKAIQAKVDKLQELEIAKTNKEIAEQEAQKAIIEAQGKSDAAIVAAEGDKKANELKQASLTDAILRQMWIQKWDGKLPQVSGDDVSPIMDMRNKE